MNTNLYEATSLISQSFAIDHKKGIGEARSCQRENRCFLSVREDCEGSLFAEKEVSIITSTSNIFYSVIIYNDAILHPKLIKFCNLIRLFTGFSRFRCRWFAADIQRLWPIARCSLAGSSGVGLTSIPVDFIRRCDDYWHCIPEHFY